MTLLIKIILNLILDFIMGTLYLFVLLPITIFCYIKNCVIFKTYKDWTVIEEKVHYLYQKIKSKIHYDI